MTADPIDIFVGNAVAVRRKALGITQIALAKELGVSFQQVQKYEKGANRISASKLSQIAGVLRMPLSDFFETAGSDQPLSGKALKWQLPSREAVTLNKAFVSIKDNSIRAAILELVDALAARDGQS